MPFLLALVARAGVPQRFQRLAAIGTAIVGVIALCGLVVGAWALALHRHDKRVIENHDAEREAQASQARETASDERAADAVTNTKNEEDLHHAIDAAPKTGTISPAAHALACERLRKRGHVPASCRPPGGDGSQADPH